MTENTADDNFQKMKTPEQAAYGGMLSQNQNVCPHCGYCPTCGRPYGNWNYPQYPQVPTYPWNPIVYCTGAKP